MSRWHARFARSSPKVSQCVSYYIRLRLLDIPILGNTSSKTTTSMIILQDACGGNRLRSMVNATVCGQFVEMSATTEVRFSETCSDMLVLYRSKGPCDVFDPWVRWERDQVGIWEFFRRRRRLEIWKSGNHEIWAEMGPYGSIWLDTAAKMIVRTLHIFFVFKKSIKIGLGSKKEAHNSKKVLPRGPKKRSMTHVFFSKICNFQTFKIRPFRMSSY